MGSALLIFIWLLFLSVAFVAAAWTTTDQLAPEGRGRRVFRWLLLWYSKGLVVPLTLWTVMNLGVSWSLQPFMPQVQAAQNSGGNWIPAFLRVLAAGLFIVSSYWTALTMGWTLVQAGRGLEAEPRSEFKALCWTCFIVMLAPAVIIVLLGGLRAGGLAAIAILLPIAGYAPAILRRKRLPPMIRDRFKGTHLAHMAQLRIQQLPDTAEELRQQRKDHPIPLPALGDTLDEGPGSAESALARDEAVEMANACVEKLKRDPNHVPSREKLARLFAERLNQPDLGLEQITLLLNMPDQPEAKRAEWLSLTAAWHLKYRQDFGAGRKILERLLHEFPESPQAFAARGRI